MREFGYANLKPELLDVVEAFVKGRDVFAVLPTGYGKSLCFGSLVPRPHPRRGEGLVSTVCACARFLRKLSG